MKNKSVLRKRAKANKKAEYTEKQKYQNKVIVAVKS